MQKKTSSQIYTKKQSSQGRDQSPNELIANIAKSLMVGQGNSAQKKAADNFQSSETTEIKALLERISAQLECMQQQNSLANQPARQSQSEDAQSGGNNQTEAQVTQQLQTLFQQLLNSQNEQNSQSQQNNPMVSDAGEESDIQSSGQDERNKMTAQTAAQALAQAQYELSNELEASLKKLKQVISESEKLANKISNLLGKENNK
ncbi:MAG: hypothetical protein N2491_02900 [Negativicutes bacterium]|nr:hypothetical protein [Negativicutes bacterium]